MSHLTERDRQAEELSKEIIALARNSIFLHLRFMDRAVGNLPAVPNMNCGFAGSSSCILYSPWTLIHTYQADQNAVARNLLHSILHNVFRHNLVGEGMHKNLWDLATDIAVENAITELGQEFLRAKREAEQAPAIEYLKERLRVQLCQRSV